MTLTKLHRFEDGYFAVWRDEIGSFTVIHAADGRPDTTPDGVGRVPTLSADQMAQAITPPAPQRETAVSLAQRGAEARPDLAERMHKAADLVEAGAVLLLENGDARVTGSRVYRVDAESCTCPDFQHRAPDGWCKHRLAVRMARALGQQPATAETLAQQAREQKLARRAAAQAEGRQMDRGFRQWCATPDGARRYVTSAAARGSRSAAANSKLAQKLRQALEVEQSATR